MTQYPRLQTTTEWIILKIIMTDILEKQDDSSQKSLDYRRNELRRSWKTYYLIKTNRASHTIQYNDEWETERAKHSNAYQRTGTDAIVSATGRCKNSAPPRLFLRPNWALGAGRHELTNQRAGACAEAAIFTLRTTKDSSMQNCTRIMKKTTENDNL
uniref:Uncharacterized protein n=1 Tax=Romanomermis culicivorax TaxID=13658 RepID=A0A915JGJ7_ROMCU